MLRLLHGEEFVLGFIEWFCFWTQINAWRHLCIPRRGIVQHALTDQTGYSSYDYARIERALKPFRYIPRPQSLHATFY